MVFAGRVKSWIGSIGRLAGSTRANISQVLDESTALLGNHIHIAWMAVGQSDSFGMVAMNDDGSKSEPLFDVFEREISQIQANGRKIQARITSAGKKMNTEFRIHWIEHQNEFLAIFGMGRKYKTAKGIDRQAAIVTEWADKIKAPLERAPRTTEEICDAMAHISESLRQRGR